jgi:hypothetical protein
VKMYHYRDRTYGIFHGPRCIGRYDTEGIPSGELPPPALTIHGLASREAVDIDRSALGLCGPREIPSMAAWAAIFRMDSDRGRDAHR